jgi:DNA-binding NtrC family response regulator
MNAVTFTPAALNRMGQYLWPGNIRELENCIRYLTCLALERPVEADELPLLPLGTAEEGSRTFRDMKRELVQTAERDYLETALRASNGNIAAAARSSGKARRAFFELMRKHGMKRTDFDQGGARKAS